MIALVVSRGVEGLLFGVPPTDWVSYASAVVAVVGMGAVAAAVPAWRATRADPVDALRSE